MPYVSVRITREGATKKQKADLISGVTDLLSKILNKNPATTFVVIDEVELEDWGIGGLPADEFRRLQDQGSKNSSTAVRCEENQ